MSLSSQAPGTRGTAWLCRLAAAILILVAAGLHLLFLTQNCPLDLSPDEAHYWEWSRRLDWSYYSKGPLVASLIRLSCALFGDWSKQLTGTAMVAVRLPALVCGTLLLAGLYVLTLQVWRREGLALASVAAALTLPITTAGATLMTIDAPFTCLWCWALVLGHRAIFGRGGWAWPALGLVIGLGLLAKYTMVLWLVSLFLFLMASPSHRWLLRCRGLWLCLLIAGLCCAPMIWWNAHHGWIGVWHLSRRAGVATEVYQFAWYGPLIYLVLQGGLLLGVWFIAWARAMWHGCPWRDRDGARNYLWWMSAVTFGVFLAFAFVTRGGEPNWPVTAYLSGSVLMAGWLAQWWSTAGRRHRIAVGTGIATACIVGLGLTVILHLGNRVTPLLARYLPPPSVKYPLPVRRVDPTCRLRGWQTLADALDREIDCLREQGIEPVVVGDWTYLGELSFYSRREPEVHSIGVAMHCRHSQYDLWRPNPVADPAAFRGRTFLFLGPRDVAPALHAFDAIGDTVTVDYQESGVPVASWQITPCRGFRGFPANRRSGKY